MKVKLDENLSVRLVEILKRSGHEVDTVPSENLAGKPDSNVRAAARSAGRFFITQDLDFSDVRQFAPGSHPGILIVRLREPGARAHRSHRLDRQGAPAGIAGGLFRGSERSEAAGQTAIAGRTGRIIRRGVAPSMARLIPSDITRLALSGAHAPELRTLALLKDALPDDYTAFNGGTVCTGAGSTRARPSTARSTSSC